MRLNLNETVKVKLTERGKKIYREHFSPLPDGFEQPEPRIDEDGFTEIQLWVFMAMFGKSMSIGKPNVIKPLEIVFDNEEEIVHCKDCKWCDPPHIKYNNGTRENVDEDAELVTADVGVNVGGKCIAMHKIYCTAHDRENPNDYEEIVMFRSPDDYCSYGEKQVTGKLKNPDDSLVTEDSESVKEKKSKLDTDLISRQAAIEALTGWETDPTDEEIVRTLKALPPVEPKPVCEDCIDRYAVLAELDPQSYEYKVVKELPSVEPGRPKGEWMDFGECSVCRKQAYDFIEGCVEGVEYMPNFCPNCGADMRGEK